MRIGQSKDIHRLEEGYPLIIGGVKIPCEKGLVGHSDADVLSHAIAEAIIGALAKGDLGTHFSDQDPQYKGISSLIILEKVAEMMYADNYRINNIDALIVIEKPKMAPYIDLMRNNISKALSCPKDLINIKATRGEGLGFVGESKGAEAYAICLLQEN